MVTAIMNTFTGVRSSLFR